MSVVYFIQVKPNGPIKIGFTTGNVFLRVQTLQQSSPYELEWIGCFPGGRPEEAAAHSLLGGSRCRNEWFYPTAEVRAFIAEKCPDFDPIAKRDEIFHEEKRVLVKSYTRRGDPYGRCVEVAAAVRVDVYHFNKWLMRERMLDAAVIDRAVVFVRERLEAGAAE